MTVPLPLPLPLDRVPLDTTTLRARAHRILADDADLPGPEELETYLLEVRGQLMLAIPEVEAAARALPVGSPVRVAALAGVEEARRCLGAEPGATLPARIANAQRLARPLLALCDHYECLT